MLFYLKYLSKIFLEAILVCILVFFIYLVIGTYFGIVNWSKIDPNWVTAFFTAVSTIAIVLTVNWAKTSFWYTHKKDKTDRTVEFVEKIYFTEMANDIRVISQFSSKNGPISKRIMEESQKKGPTDELWNELNEKYTPKIQNVLNLLNLFGVLLKEERVDLEMFYKVFRLDMKVVWAECKFMFDDRREKESTVWEEFNYLHNKFLELDKINENKKI